MLWDWGWVWKSLLIVDSIYGIRVNGTDIGGSLQVTESTFVGCTSSAIIVSIPKGSTTQQTGYITLDNLRFDNTPIALIDSDTNLQVPVPGTGVISWILGRIYDRNNKSGWFSPGDFVLQRPNISKLLAPDGTYFERDKPQYEDLDVSSFWNAKSVAKGSSPVPKDKHMITELTFLR
jgi:hypothetical protein